MGWGVTRKNWMLNGCCLRGSENKKGSPAEPSPAIHRRPTLWVSYKCSIPVAFYFLFPIYIYPRFTFPPQQILSLVTPHHPNKPQFSTWSESRASCSATTIASGRGPFCVCIYVCIWVLSWHEMRRRRGRRRGRSKKQTRHIYRYHTLLKTAGPSAAPSSPPAAGRGPCAEGGRLSVRRRSVPTCSSLFFDHPRKSVANRRWREKRMHTGQVSVRGNRPPDVGEVDAHGQPGRVGRAKFGHGLRAHQALLGVRAVVVRCRRG